MAQTAVISSGVVGAMTWPRNGRTRADALLNEPEPNAETSGPAALEQRRKRTGHDLAKIAARRESWINRNSYYYGLLNRLLRFLVEPQKKVLSVRCGTGNLLATVRPATGK